MHGSCVCVVEIQERAGPVLLNCIEYDLTFDCSDKVLSCAVYCYSRTSACVILTRHPLSFVEAGDTGFGPCMGGTDCNGFRVPYSPPSPWAPYALTPT